MKNIFTNILEKIFVMALAMAGKEWGRDFIRHFAGRTQVNLLQLAYNDVGILNYKNHQESGELYLAREVLLGKMEMGAGSIIFDVGANIGNYTDMLRGVLTAADIYAFEPNRFAFSKLESTYGESVRCFNTGFGAVAGTGKIYTYENAVESSHASSFPKVFEDYYRTERVRELEFDMTTIDDFCREHEIYAVDFLKIDTEGNELNVIAGAKRMISDGRIRAIQFEFGECNVFSRVFLRDFYEQLEGYNLYRLNSEGMVPMGQYSVANEIFRYQNIFAVQKNIDPLKNG